MTELVMMLTFAKQCLSKYPALKRDIDKLSNIVKHVSKNNSTEYLDTLVRALSSFSDALVFGVNSRRFVYKSTVFSQKSSCAYPRLFSGVTALVFHEDGNLRPDWDRHAFEFLLQILAFVKRIKHKSLRKSADEAAKREFISYQLRHRPVRDCTAHHLRKFWNFFAREIDKHATLGFPGPGATLDEKHPYAPNFVFLNTWDPNLPEEIKLFYDACFANGTRFPDSRSWFTHPADEILPQIYELVENPRLRSVCVPKNTKVSRLITVTHVGNTIVGACYRNTIKSLWRSFGIESQLNVDDQTKSHRTLGLKFKDVSCLDLEGGSSCFTNYLNRKILPDFFVDFLDYTKNSTFVVDGCSYPVTTQLMGDSISTALLTTSLYLCVCLALWYYRQSEYIKRFDKLFCSMDYWSSDVIGSYDLMFEAVMSPSTEQISQIMSEVRDLPVNIVGDDVILPTYLENGFRSILADLGITVNDRKSSTGESNHKESCGAWYLRSSGEQPYRIYPFRFPEGESKPRQLQSATQFLNRTKNSEYILELTLALGEIYGLELHRESYTPDMVGSPCGSGLPFVIRQTATQKYASVSDTTAYMFNRAGVTEGSTYSGFERIDNNPDGGISYLYDRLSQETDRRIAYRDSRRGPSERVRFKPFVDITRRNTKNINALVRRWITVFSFVYSRYDPCLIGDRMLLTSMI